MVKGLQKFREHFEGYEEYYVLIGGTACVVQFEEAGLDFRVTKDLDIVLCVEVINQDFVKAFWEFIKAGEYEQRERSTGEKEFYRFLKPKAEDFPFQLELFSRELDTLKLADDVKLTPIPVEGETDSLSAILLNESYYQCIQDGTIIIDDIRVLKPEFLLVFKAKAFLDLNERKNNGENVNSKDVKKHRLDVFRLYQLLVPEQKVKLSDEIKTDLELFVEAMKDDLPEIASFGIKEKTAEEVLHIISDIYEIEGK